MSDYTPTTEQVCEGYSHDPEAEYRDPTTNHAALNRRAFNRWLAEHDRQVKEEAWDEGFEASEEENEAEWWPGKPAVPNPYRSEQ